MEKRTSLRPLGTPTPIRVRTDGRGRPLAVVLMGGGEAGARRRAGLERKVGARRTKRAAKPHHIEAIRESWRIDDEWWRRPISRLYHEVVLETGGTLVIYRDLEEGGWYVHGRGGPVKPARSRRTRPGGAG